MARLPVRTTGLQPWVSKATRANFISHAGGSSVAFTEKKPSLAVRNTARTSPRSPTRLPNRNVRILPSCATAHGSLNVAGFAPSVPSFSSHDGRDEVCHLFALRDEFASVGTAPAENAIVTSSFGTLLVSLSAGAQHWPSHPVRAPTASLRMGISPS